MDCIHVVFDKYRHPIEVTAGSAGGVYSRTETKILKAKHACPRCEKESSCIEQESRAVRAGVTDYRVLKERIGK